LFSLFHYEQEIDYNMYLKVILREKILNSDRDNTDNHDAC